MTKFRIGDRVDCEDRGKGVVAYYGETQFRPGIWVGVFLDEAKGKNNGTVEGVKYFECKDNHGVFIKPNKVHLLKPPSASIRKPGSIKTSPAHTPRINPAASSERSVPHKTQSESMMSRVSEAEGPKDESPKHQAPKTSIPKPAPIHEQSDLPAPSLNEPMPQASFLVDKPEPVVESANVQHRLDRTDNIDKKLENMRKKHDEGIAKINETLVEFKTSVLKELDEFKKRYEDLQSKLDESEKRYKELKTATSGMPTVSEVDVSKEEPKPSTRDHAASGMEMPKKHDTDSEVANKTSSPPSHHAKDAAFRLILIALAINALRYAFSLMFSIFTFFSTSNGGIWIFLVTIGITFAIVLVLLRNTSLIRRYWPFDLLCPNP